MPVSQGPVPERRLNLIADRVARAGTLARAGAPVRPGDRRAAGRLLRRAHRPARVPISIVIRRWNGRDVEVVRRRALALVSRERGRLRADRVWTRCTEVLSRGENVASGLHHES